MLTDERTVSNYDRVSRINHWTIAVLMIGMLCFGLYLEYLVPAGPEKGALIGIHKAIGMIVLVIGGWRLAWRLRQGFLSEASVMPKWQEATAHLAHWFLLIAVVLMPVTGVIGSLFGGHAISMFGLFSIAPFATKIEWLSSLAYQTHGVLAMITIGVVVLHVAGALKHHFVDRDKTVLRMLGRA